jgi:hypothetical protein
MIYPKQKSEQPKGGEEGGRRGRGKERERERKRGDEWVPGISRYLEAYRNSV